MNSKIFRKYLEINSIKDLKEVLKPSDNYSLENVNPTDFQINKLRVYRQIAIPITFLIVIFFFFIIIPPLYNSIRSFLENANDYQDRVILLIDFLLRWTQNRLGIDLDIITIEESIRDLPFLNWASDLLGHTAHFFETLFIILIILLFLMIGENNKEKTYTWYQIHNSIKTPEILNFENMINSFFLL